MTRQRQTVVCREGWYYLVVIGLVFGGAMLREVNLLLVLGGMLAGPTLLSWWAVGRTLRGLQVQRRAPQEICAGDLLVANLRLTNTRRRFGSWDVIIEEQLLPEAASRHNENHREKPIRPRVLIPYVPAGQSRRGVYRGRLPQRGRYRLGPIWLSTRFPFGLLRRTITLPQTDTLTVFPRLGRLTRRWATRHRESFEGTHRRERRHGAGGDFYGIREWHNGDSRRWIHWRSSARVGQLVVCQFEQPRNHDVAVLVDLWQPERPKTEHLHNVELAVSFAATVVAELCRTGGNNLLLSIGGGRCECIDGVASAVLLREVMGYLAVAEARSEDGLAEMLQQAMKRIQPGTEIVLVTTRPVDFDDSSRFASLWSDPTQRALARAIRCIDTSTEELAEYFQPE